MSTQEQNTPEEMHIALKADAVYPVLKALHERINTRNLSDERQQQEFKQLVESVQRIQNSLRAYNQQFRP